MRRHQLERSELSPNRNHGEVVYSSTDITVLAAVVGPHCLFVYPVCFGWLRCLATFPVVSRTVCLGVSPQDMAK